MNNINSIRIETVLKNDYLKQMIKLDNENYAENNVGIYNTCMAWYNKNSKIYTIALRGNTVVGYINFTPLTDDAYLLYKKGIISDAEITENEIQSFQPNKNHKCLFMSIVVSPSERGGDATRMLTEHFKKNLKVLNNNKYIISSILADCVSLDGEKFIKRLGFKKILKTDRNSTLYEIKNKKGILL